jgi:hypothetical protein
VEHFAIVICHGLEGSPHFGSLLYGSCPMRHLYFVEPSFVIVIRVMLLCLKQIDILMALLL